MVFLKNLFRNSKKWRVSEEEIKKNNVVLFLIPNRLYQTELVHITKRVENIFSKILYISLNRPAEKVISTLKNNNIDTKKFLFIDAITNEVKPNVSNHDITYINSPKNFEKFDTELNQILKNKKFDCIIFDSVSTMLIYKEESLVIKFIHDFITKLIVAHASGEIICLSKDDKSALVKDISMFADEVIDMSEKKVEIKQEGLKKKEKIQKLENELKSIRQAYTSKFVSETSYLKTKERIDKTLKKLKV